MAEGTFVENPDYPIELNDDTLDEAVNNYPFLVVDCWAEWCGPCRMLGPIIESLAKKHQGDIVFAKIDVDKNNKTASRYGIRSIPNLLVFKDGAKAGDIVGAMPEDKLLERINTFKG
ncbi:MAG: thioredoxin [Desulfomonilia bacterium]|jgi:thioredoxin 1|nr:thioredoxin [Deltaproteobacteria bacterium]MDX9762813.1 thioredoxin [Desulfomonilia bacterium]HPW68117.1 thioredoxin [Deltaproteobacteria bacterium]